MFASLGTTPRLDRLHLSSGRCSAHARLHAREAGRALSAADPDSWSDGMCTSGWARGPGGLKRCESLSVPGFHLVSVTIAVLCHRTMPSRFGHDV